MRIVRPQSIPNVDDARLIDSIAQCDAAIADDDTPRGNMVRYGARRALYQFALRDRGHDIDTGTANRTACARVWAVDPFTFTPQPKGPS